METKDQILASLTERKVALQKVMTPNLFEDLLKYGIYRLKSQFKINYDLERGFRGIMIEDLISEVLASFIKPDGRNWNKTNFPKFHDQLLSSYDSHICNTVNKELEKAIATKSIPENDNTLGHNNSESYDDLLEVIMEILDRLGCSDDEILLFEPYYINKMKREDIANTLGMSVNDITNVKKQLDRKLPKLRYELKKMNYER